MNAKTEENKVQAAPASAEEAAKKAELAAVAKKAEEEALKNLENEPADASELEAFESVASSAAEDRRAAASRAEEAAKKLRLLATSYPNTTPNEHTVFGFGGHRFTLGELRALFGLPNP